jgi:hypothetical protein
MMHALASLLPDWKSLESVRRAHNGFEFTALVFFAALVVFDTLAHLTEDSDPERAKKLEKVGLICFAIAVIAEIVTYPLSRRNDFLSDEQDRRRGIQIQNLDQVANAAKRNATSASEDASRAKQDAKDAASAAHSALLEADAYKGQIIEATREAENARLSAIAASNAASGAVKQAQDARRETDSFEQKIAKAERDASAAEAHLGEAMQRAREAIAELERLRTPRSLIDIDALVSKLRPFTGTEYRLAVFQDDESIQFTKKIEDALHRAGWTRKPSPYRLGIPSIQVFGSDRAQAIPICIETGIQIHFRSEESLDVKGGVKVSQ